MKANKNTKIATTGTATPIPMVVLCERPPCGVSLGEETGEDDIKVGDVEEDIAEVKVDIDVKDGEEDATGVEVGADADDAKVEADVDAMRPFGSRNTPCPNAQQFGLLSQQKLAYTSTIFSWE